MLISLHEHFPVRITDWLLAAILFTWGLALFLIDPRVWALPIYSGLAFFGSQAEWAIAATSLGILRLAVLFVNGAIRPSPHLRCVGAFLSTFIWVQLSLGQLVSDFAGLAIAVYPWLAFADIFNSYRAAGDARAADLKAQQQRSAVAARVSERT